jgi:hypothetical protein
VFPHRARQLISRLLRSLEPHPFPSTDLSTEWHDWQQVRQAEPPAKERGSHRIPRQGPLHGSLGASTPAAPRPDGPAPVLCVIADASASAVAALNFAAQVAGRRCDRGSADLTVVLVCQCPLFVMADPAPDFQWLEAGAGVRAMLDEVSEEFGIALRVHEIAGWSQADIIRIAVERRSGIVILPILDDGAGPLMRWRQRDLVSALIERTHAVVMDEYDRPLAGKP